MHRMCLLGVSSIRDLHGMFLAPAFRKLWNLDMVIHCLFRHRLVDELVPLEVFAICI